MKTATYILVLYNLIIYISTLSAMETSDDYHSPAAWVAVTNHSSLPISLHFQAGGNTIAYTAAPNTIWIRGSFDRSKGQHKIQHSYLFTDTNELIISTCTNKELSELKVSLPQYKLKTFCTPFTTIQCRKKAVFYQQESPATVTETYILKVVVDINAIHKATSCIESHDDNKDKSLLM